MDPARGLEDLRRHIPGDAPVMLEIDDLGHLLVYTRRDMLHLDADALHDRLHAWVVRQVRPVLPHVDALVSFRHARPATWDEAELDTQEAWHGLEPTLRLDAAHASAAEVRGFAELLPAFLALVEASGRPAGWRVIDHGNAE